MVKLSNGEFVIENVSWNAHDHTLQYQYNYSAALAKYFSKQNSFFAKYPGVNLAGVPKSILVIPLLSQILPIAWFAGFNVRLDELDSEFYQSMIHLQPKLTAGYNLKKESSRLLPGKLISNKIATRIEKPLLLFSGGVDSIYTFLPNHPHRTSQRFSVPTYSSTIATSGIAFQP